MCLGVPGTDRRDRRPRADARRRRRVGGAPGRSTSPASSTRAHPIETCIGDWVLIHVGFAMARIDEAEAAETLKVLTQIGDMQDELDAMRAFGRAVSRETSP